MFYSQTFLERKGPLGTVWCAAHLQHRLKKSHYTATNISSTVERIMFPKVPIALRMSGHLLLGVVRIYSKKVDYLFQDCNTVLSGLRKAFATIQLTLPEDLRRAPVQSITLPDTFDLDALNLDDAIDYDGLKDNHLRSQEDITLPDQIPLGTDHYVAMHFDEDIMIDSSHTEILQDSEDRPMDVDIPPQSPVTNVAGFQDPSPSNPGQSPTAQHTDGQCLHNFRDPEATHALGSPDCGTSNQTEVLNSGTSGDSSPQAMPEIEVLRDACHDSNLEDPPPVYPDHGDNNTEPNIFVEQIMNEKDHIPSMIDDLDLGGPSMPYYQHSRPQTSATFQDAPEIQLPDEHISLNLELRASPQKQQPKKRGRKRKQFFDEPVVLTNQYMKKSLNDSSDLVRKTRTTFSSMTMWRVNNSRLKEQIFYRPFMTGLSVDLLDMSKGDYIFAKPHLVISEEDHADPGIARTPSPTGKTPEEPRDATSPVVSAQDTEIEHLCGVAATPPATIPALEVEMGLQNNEDDGSNPARNDDLTPVSAKRLKSISVSPLRSNNVKMPTPDLSSSTGSHGLDMETPSTFLEDRTFGENFGLSDTCELINSAEAETQQNCDEELYFLETDNDTPASSKGSEGVNSLSARTRAVAQYLKRHSPINPISEDVDGDLSLSRILEGRTRKLSARMLFQILVLKSHKLIDVQQDEPYDDVSLKLTPTLSKAQI